MYVCVRVIDLGEVEKRASCNFIKKSEGERNFHGLQIFAVLHVRFFFPFLPCIFTACRFLSLSRRSFLNHESAVCIPLT